MHRELLLLGLLRNSDMHGYQINDFIERSLYLCTDLKKSTAYFLLDKMQKVGWIKWYEEQAGNRPARRVYSLTDQGEAQFQLLLRENLSATETPTFTTDIGLAFSEALPPEEVRTLLNEKRKLLGIELASLKDAPLHTGNLQLILEHRQLHLESELQWIDRLIARYSTSS
jgi:DNA-binding PadR family transcriptional regulator